MKKLAIIFITICIMSCSSNHKIHIKNNNSASVNFSVTNKQSLIDTLLEWGTVQNSDTLIDTEQITIDLEKDDNISDVIITSPKNNNYKGSFVVNNIDKLFNNNDVPKELQIFSITDTEDGKNLKIQISLENYIYLKQSLPFLQEESIDMLGPDANQDITEEEYLDMMSFSLGHDGPKDILDSNIELEISVDGTIMDIDGGKIVSSNKAIFKVNLIDVILLKKKLVYSITYI